ncbi:aspartate aminotransferase family protein [Kineosporia sp. J2-2]|uniref:Aspartate aminotransferase family protein n=1 Tax=Kineosporia corallincola TaxID=2835133 RepID=A0ABS5TQE1_9ACTN|nr:aspartate aminotransferase family protein [Kineosporia corallincola]MBT0773328.1 aspartate aminotransferase family protein [Kineosporia corallincola]
MSGLAASGFLNRYAASFGRNKALLLRMSGLTAGEVSAEGAWITDENGRRWLDFGSFGVHLLGHRHPAVTAVAHAQLDRMGLSGKILGNHAATACAQALLASGPPGLDRVSFANTGSEAVEMAIKLAVLATGRTGLVALRGSYHGKTTGALRLSGSMTDRLPPELVPSAVFTDPRDPADRERLRQLLRTCSVAAVFAEPVQGEGGILPLDTDYLTFLREETRSTGTLLVLDEIQTGLGRCGRTWRSATDVRPDLLLAGKVLGGGLLPVAAVLYSSGRIGDSNADPVVLASSFAGGALAGAVGATVLELVTRDEFLTGVHQLGERTRHRLRELFAGDARITEVRGEGLMIGLQTAGPQVAGHVVLEAARRGVLVSFCLSDPRVLRIYPPAVTGAADLDDGLDRLAEAVAATPFDPENASEKGLSHA